MQTMFLLLAISLLLAIEATITGNHRSQRSNPVIRQAAVAVDFPEVDLGYAIYRGTHDRLSGINAFRGYARPYALYGLHS